LNRSSSRLRLPADEIRALGLRAQRRAYQEDGVDLSLALWRRCLAEGIAAFALVFGGCGAIVADSRYHGALGRLGVALVFGLVIMVMVYATGHLSGAHINPAVTTAFTLTRHFTPRDALAYVAAQLTGATAGALVLLAVWTDAPANLGATVPSVGTGSALVYEVLLTAFLMFVIMAVATDTRAVGAGAAIAIGGTVGLDALFGGPITGASMNPARSLGPAIAASEWRDLWIYLIGPLVGAALGGFAYQLVRGEHPEAAVVPAPEET
jgi:aquaporin NIP